MGKIFIAILTLLVFSVSTPAYASDEEVDSFNIVMDAALVRPLGLVSIAVGASLFILSLPFTAIGGDMDKAARVLVREPIDYTFRRPLGEFEKRKYKYKSN